MAWGAAHPRRQEAGNATREPLGWTASRTERVRDGSLYLPPPATQGHLSNAMSRRTRACFSHILALACKTGTTRELLQLRSSSLSVTVRPAVAHLMPIGSKAGAGSRLGGGQGGAGKKLSLADEEFVAEILHKYDLSRDGLIQVHENGNRGLFGAHALWPRSHSDAHRISQEPELFELMTDLNGGNRPSKGEIR